MFLFANAFFQAGAFRRLRALGGLSWTILALLVGAALVGPVAVAADEDVTRAEIQRIIEAQIDAFRRDDSAAAFGFASPGIQARFGTADTFMSMVRQGYQPVYRPRAVEFGALEMVRGRLTQNVLVIGPDGMPVQALYPMEQQDDGSWRIDGCVLVAFDGEGA